MRGAEPLALPAEGSFMRGAEPLALPAEGSFMRGASSSRSPEQDDERVAVAGLQVARQLVEVFVGRPIVPQRVGSHIDGFAPVVSNHLAAAWRDARVGGTLYFRRPCVVNGRSDERDAWLGQSKPVLDSRPS